MNDRQRQLTYNALVAERKACEACKGHLTNPATLDHQLDSDRLGPWTRWQGNLRAPLIVIGQDFADETTFKRVRGYPGSDVETNRRLIQLMKAAGFVIAQPDYPRSDDTLFFTNAVLCLKPGGMRSHVHATCFRNCGQRFLLPTIQLVAPRAIATLGTGALDALLHACGKKRAATLTELVAGSVPVRLPNMPPIFPLFHPMASRRLEAQRMDWSRLKTWLQ